jgi:hypothetical protein
VLSGAGASADPPGSYFICHRSNAAANPYQLNSPNNDRGLLSHLNDSGPVYTDGLKNSGVRWGDIIPPFTDRSGHVHSLNWSTAGIKIHDDRCAVGATTPGDGETTSTTDPGDGQTTSTTDPGDGQTTSTTDPGDGQTTSTTDPGDGQTTSTTGPGDGQTTGTTNPGGGGTTGGGTTGGGTAGGGNGGTTGGGNGGAASGGNTGGHHSGHHHAGHHHSGHHHAGHHGTHSSGPGGEILGTEASGHKGTQATGHKGTQPRDHAITEVKPASGTRPVANGGPVVVPTAVDAGLATWTAPTGSGETTLTTQLAEGAMGGGLLMLLAGGWLRFGRRERGAREA